MAAESLEDLLQQNRELRERLEEAEEILRALRGGEVDAIVTEGPQGERVYTLRGADEAYRVMVEGMADGALTLKPDGLILFANEQFAGLAGVPLERVIGSRIQDFTAEEDADLLAALLRGEHDRKAELRLKREGAPYVPVYLSVDNLVLDDAICLCVIVTDLVEQKRNQEIVAAEKLARSILEQVAEAILVVDPEGRVARASRAADSLAGAAVVHRRFDEVFQISLGSGEAYPFGKILAAAGRSGTMTGVEAYAVTRDGRGIDVLLSAATLAGAGASLLGCVVTMIDITERKRRERQIKFQADILEATTEAVIAVDPEYRVTVWNSGAERAYGVPREEALGKPLGELYQWFWADPAEEQSAAAALEQRGMWSGENIHLLRDGSQIIVSSNVNRIAEEYGGGMLAVIRDITERKRAEAAARENDLQFRTLADSIPQLAWMTDARGRMTWFNQRWYEYTGTTPEEMEAREWQTLLPGDHVTRVEAHRRYCLETGRAWEDTFPLRARDGGYRWFLSRAQPIRNSRGEVVRWFGTNTDITERRTVEEALRESEARFRRLYEADIVGIVCSDGEKVFEANDLFLKMVGRSREDLAAGGIPRAEMTPPESVAADRRAIEELAVTGSCKPFERELLRKDGTRAPVLIGMTLLQRSPMQWLSFILDLTERKSLEKKLLEKQKLESVGLLAGGIAHDFNNLLVGILGNASIAQDMLPPGSPVVQFLEEVVVASERAAHLTRQMLAYSGKGQFVIEQVNLSRLTQEVTRLVQSTIPNRIAVHLDLHPNPPVVEADPGQIQQVIMNLVINAAEAIGEQTGLIAVRTGTQTVDAALIRDRLDGLEIQPGMYVCLEVRDTGQGIDDATLPRIFDPFFTTKFTGRGLGLAAVSGIVRGHKGAITVRSAPGEGSTFLVLFPAGRSAAVEPEEPAATAAAVTEKAETVLVVDDEPVVLRTAKLALERRGYVALQAESGPAAIEILKRERDRVAVVVLDLSMPGMSGQETLPELRKIQPGIEVIVSSGYSESEALRIFSGQEISGFLQKPYSAARLTEKIQSVITGR